MPAPAFALAALLFAGSASGPDAADQSFTAIIFNDCARAVTAHFVVPAPGTRDITEEQIKQSPPVRLEARSRTTRRMVPRERLVIVDRSAQFKAWFRSKQEGEAGQLRFGPDCNSIVGEPRPLSRR